jgi:hypothetical protein
LGQFNVPSTGGSLIYNGQLTPLTDIFGNTVVVPLSGTNTLRETAISNQGYNLEYLLLVAAPSVTGTLPPYLATASPAPNANGVGLATPISFTIANRQTTVNPASIKLFTNSVQVTSGIVSNANAAGISVTFTPGVNRLANTTYTITVIYTDSSSTSFTNSWTFVTGTTGGVNGNGIWSGLGGTNNMIWASATNWSGSTPGPTFFAAFNSLGATANLVTNNIVSTNVTIGALFYATNSNGYNTTWIQDGVTLTISNGTASTTAALQVGGSINGDNSSDQPVTNTISGGNGTLVIVGNNPQQGTNANALNFQVRQAAIGAAVLPNLVTLDMSGLGNLNALIGKFYVAQGGAGANQANVSGCVFLARTNFIACLRANNAGVFEVGDSSGGTVECPGSSLYLGINNSFYADTVRIGKQKSTNNLVEFNPAFTSITTPTAYIRGTNALPSATARVTYWSIGDDDSEATVPAYAQGNVDFSGGKLDALVGNLTLGRGETLTTDTGYAQGALTFTAGTLDVLNLTNGLQRAASTATESGVVNVNGTATLVCPNIVLAATSAGANASLVTGTLNVTNGTVRGGIFAGGGVSTVNVNSGTLIVSNAAGTAAAPLTTLNLNGASLHLKVDANAPAAKVYAAAVSATGTTIVIDSVANVTGTSTIHLISYSGSDPYNGLALAPLPPGYSGTLMDNGGSIDLTVNVAPTTPPTIRKIIVVGGQLIISGTNNVGAIGAGGGYQVLTSTNVSLALANWTVLTNGNFDINGNFSSTNAIGTSRTQYFILRLP